MSCPLNHVSLLSIVHTSHGHRKKPSTPPPPPPGDMFGWVSFGDLWLGATLIWPIHANSVIYVLRAQECMLAKRLVLFNRPRSNFKQNPK